MQRSVAVAWALVALAVATVAVEDKRHGGSAASALRPRAAHKQATLAESASEPRHGHHHSWLHARAEEPEADVTTMTADDLGIDGGAGVESLETSDADAAGGTESMEAAGATDGVESMEATEAKAAERQASRRKGSRRIRGFDLEDPEDDVEATAAAAEKDAEVDKTADKDMSIALGDEPIDALPAAPSPASAASPGAVLQELKTKQVQQKKAIETMNEEVHQTMKFVDELHEDVHALRKDVEKMKGGATGGRPCALALALGAVFLGPFRTALL